MKKQELDDLIARRKELEKQPIEFDTLHLPENPSRQDYDNLTDQELSDEYDFHKKMVNNYRNQINDDPMNFRRVKHHERLMYNTMELLGLRSSNSQQTKMKNHVSDPVNLDDYKNLIKDLSDDQLEAEILYRKHQQTIQDNKGRNWDESAVSYERDRKMAAQKELQNRK